MRWLRSKEIVAPTATWQTCWLFLADDWDALWFLDTTPSKSEGNLKAFESVHRWVVALHKPQGEKVIRASWWHFRSALITVYKKRPRTLTLGTVYDLDNRQGNQNMERSLHLFQYIKIKQKILIEYTHSLLRNLGASI